MRVIFTELEIKEALSAYALKKGIVAHKENIDFSIDEREEWEEEGGGGMSLTYVVSAVVDMAEVHSDGKGPYR